MSRRAQAQQKFLRTLAAMLLMAHAASGVASSRSAKNEARPTAASQSAQVAPAAVPGGSERYQGGDSYAQMDERLRSHRTLGEFLRQKWYLAALGLGIFTLFMMVKRWLTGPPPKPKETGRLATVEEQAEVYGVPWGQGGFMLGRQIEPEVTPREKLLRGAGNLLKEPPPKPPRQEGEDERVLRTPFDLRTMHTIIEAGSGAGKTSSTIIPQVVEDAFSGVCNTFLVDRRSPEMIHYTGGAWQAAGHNVIYFDPWDKGLTWGMEPVFGASPDFIRAMVEAHVQVSFDPGDVTKIYREQERAVLETLFLCAQEWGKRERRLATLPGIAELIALGFETTKVAIENARPDLNRRLIDQWKLSDAEQGKLFRSIASRMNIYLIPEVAAAFSRRDFTIDDIVVPFEHGGDGGMRTLMIVGASQAKGAAGEWIASFITQLVMHAVYERGLQMKRAGARWPHTVPLSMYLDEIGTYQIGRWEDFQAVARDGGVAITCSLQDRLQFDRINGQNSSLRLLRNNAHKIYMRGMDEKAARELSQSIGNQWVVDEGRSSSSGSTSLGATSSTGRQLRWVERPILTADQISFMPKDRALVFGATHPFMVELVPYYQSPRINAIVEKSIRWARSKRDRNLRCDNEGVERPGLEIKQLRKPTTDWTPVVGKEVMETGAAPRRMRITSGAPGGQNGNDPNDLPMPKRERSVIEAKCKILSVKNIDELCQRQVRKNFGEITKGEAGRVIAHLEEEERRFDEAKVAAG
jgi:type IV secretory pathway TraG/TraD family ATPase VirD4